MTDSKKSYYAVIPANIRYDESLPPNAKLLYGEITALCNAEGYCWASNRYFADLYNVSPITISRWINLLVSRGYITSQIIYKEGTNQIDNRYIQICYDPINKNVNTPINKIIKDNNTSFNNTLNNTSEYVSKSDKPTRTRFIPPSLEEVRAYCEERNKGVIAEKWYDHYSAVGWKVGRNPMKDWKAAVRTWEQNGTGQAQPTQQKSQSEYDRFMSGLAEFVKESE
ncbi:MAG: helix-turn-helix domain-containing protein [Clostridia bacterium]|nr:helix-turn-helix domain-containing protein [Clostridia bacterium]